MTKELRCPYCDNKVSRSGFEKIQNKMRDELEKQLAKEKSKLKKNQEKLEKEKEKLDGVVEKRVADLLESKLEKATKRDEERIGEKPVYVIKGVKEGKLLAVIPVNMDTDVMINAANGKIESTKKPWWSILVR